MITKVPGALHFPCLVPIVHYLDQDSPFYELPAFEFVNNKFEQLVIMRDACKTSSMGLHCKQCRSRKFSFGRTDNFKCWLTGIRQGKQLYEFLPLYVMKFTPLL